jgi:hypothetical protein
VQKSEQEQARSEIDEAARTAEEKAEVSSKNHIQIEYTFVRGQLWQKRHELVFVCAHVLRCHFAKGWPGQFLGAVGVGGVVVLVELVDY